MPDLKHVLVGILAGKLEPGLGSPVDRPVLEEGHFSGKQNPVSGIVKVEMGSPLAVPDTVWPARDQDTSGRNRNLKLAFRAELTAGQGKSDSTESI